MRIGLVLGVLWAGLGLAAVSAHAQAGCTSRQLKLSEGAPDGGTGHLAHAYQVTNSSTGSCVLEGAPQLQLLDRRGRVVDAPVCVGCGDYLFGARAGEVVVLKPGESANFLLGAFHGSRDEGPCGRFSRVRVRLPAGGAPLEFGFAGGEDADTCGLHESVWQAGPYSANEDRPGSAAKDPLPFLHARDVVVFQGDSITDGGRAQKGNDLNHTMGQDYAYLIAAEVGAESPERKLLFLNRGISGNRVPDLEARWQTDTIALKPQLLSILIGVNDTLATGDRAASAEQFEAGYDALLAETVAALPGTKIVLGQPFLLPVGKHKDGYAAEMVEVKKRQAAVDRLASKYKLPVVRYQEAFDRASATGEAQQWCWDGVHPTYAGHGLMAREWRKTVDAAWR